MNKIKSFIQNPKLIYKTLMCVCIGVLCFLTVLITDNGQKNTSATKEEITETESVLVEEEKIDEIIEDLSEKEPEVKEEENEIISAEALQPSFSQPLFGTVQKPFSPENVLYSKTMDDWRIHMGVDITAPIGTDVTASEGGTVTYTGYDINLGYVVRIKSGDYECVYASLDSKNLVEENDYVHKGQIIGILSDSCISEICDEPHLHFEMLKNGEYVNPEEYVTFGY